MCWIWPGGWGCIGDSLTSDIPGGEVSNDNTQVLYFNQGQQDGLDMNLCQVRLIVGSSVILDKVYTL